MKAVIVIGYKKLSRTDKVICTGKKNGYDFYRRVYVDEIGRYYVKENKKLWNVSEDFERFRTMTVRELKQTR